MCTKRAQSHLLHLLLLLYSSLLIASATANVLVIGHNTSFSVPDIEANFAPVVKGPGVCGVLYVAEPIDACDVLTNKIDPVVSAFALIVRGGCTFEDKVRRAQSAGFKAAIVDDNEDNEALVAMAGSSSGIKIHAVFVSKVSGETLKDYAGYTDTEVWIIPAYDNSAWSIMAISFISLLAISAVLATCFFVRRHRIRRGMPRASRIREFHGMSSRLVKAMPSLIFTAVVEDNTTSRTCAICLEDYTVGEKLRVLPCCHKFHAMCVDSWLTSWRTFCPVCKRDARTSTGDPPVSESTPLLSSGLASFSSAASLSSIQSSIAASSVIQITPAVSRSPSVSHSYSLSSTPYAPQSRRSYNNLQASSLSSSVDIRNRSPSVSHSYSLSSTPYAPQSRRSYNNLQASSLSSSVDIRNASFHRSYASLSMGYPSLSSFNSRYIPPNIPSSSNASPSNVGSSSRLPCLLHCTESAGSLSPFASAHSLSGC